MKKVLIVIHLPRASPRVFGLMKYLPDFGWQPIVLTGVTGKRPDLPVRIIETPYRNALGFAGRILGVSPESDARQQVRERLGVTSSKSPLDFLFSLAGEIINYPCPDKNWRPFAMKAAEEFLEKEKVDAIVSSSPPVIAHIIGRELKKRYGTPWMADLRDLWSFNHNYGYSRARRMLDSRLEVRTLGGADVLLTTSEPWAARLRTIHAGKPVYSVTHGFDPAELSSPPTKLSSKFTITYTGTIYPGKQNPVTLFTALRDLISEGTMKPEDVEVRFYGPVLPWLTREIERHGLSKVVLQYGTVPITAALEKQRESHLLLLLDWNDPREKGLYTGKVFEYLGSMRPILAIGGVADNVVDLLLAETRTGVHAPTIDSITEALKVYYQEYLSTGRVAYHGIGPELNKYSQREMTKRFANVLDHLKHQ